MNDGSKESNGNERRRRAFVEICLYSIRMREGKEGEACIEMMTTTLK